MIAIGLMFGLGLPFVDDALAEPQPSSVTIVSTFAQPVSPDSSTDTARLLDRIVKTKDNHGMSFAIVDKKNARVFAFGPEGVLKGSSAVLLGLAKGDDSVPGIGERKMADIKPFERTTPAGRFDVEPGRNLQGEDIIWVDYDVAISMHRVRTANRADRRLERLASRTVADNRISYGCINVPAAFYDAHFRDTLGAAGGVVYILPEKQSLEARFGALLKTSVIE